MTDTLKSYLEARQQLQQEKTQLESRLRQINSVLSGVAAAAVPKLARRGRPPKAAAPAELSTEKPASRKRRRMSAEARARIAAAAKARWAKAKAAGKRKL